MSVRPAAWLEGRTCEHKPLPYFFRSCWMLSVMLFKVWKQLPSSLQVWGFVYFCWFGVSLQVSNCIASGIVPKHFFAGGILVFTHRLICFLQLFPCLRTEDRRGERQRERERKREGEREGERERGREGGKGRDRKIERERERENVLERACWCVLLVEMQQVSEVLLRNLWKVHACCHDNMFALLSKGVSLFKVSYRSPQEITHF